jgi:hypothetical protein
MPKRARGLSTPSCKLGRFYGTQNFTYANVIVLFNKPPPAIFSISTTRNRKQDCCHRESLAERFTRIGTKNSGISKLAWKWISNPGRREWRYVSLRKVSTSLNSIWTALHEDNAANVLKQVWSVAFVLDNNNRDNHKSLCLLKIHWIKGAIDIWSICSLLLKYKSSTWKRYLISYV